MNDNFLDFSNKDYWDEELKNYVQNGGTGELVLKIWRYFKYCLLTDNRFFFQNPLVPLIETQFQKNTCVLHKGELIYRARIDDEYEYWEECRKYAEEKDYESTLQSLNDEPKNLQEAYYQEELNELHQNHKYQCAKERIKSGFEGFNAIESGAPPYFKVDAGRCNPKGVVFLYCANDTNTAVAEIRPYIRDSVSVATLRTEKELRLVNFYYGVNMDGTITEQDGNVIIKNSLFHNIRAEFSIVNKGDKNEYLITQYLTLLAKKLGYDGICFRSSLYQGGRNYVLFDSENCTPISSKLYVIPKVEYTLVPVI